VRGLGVGKRARLSDRAVASGISWRTAPRHRSSAVPEARGPLVDAWVYRMTPERPELVRRLEQGDIAFYGPILEATPDPELASYLVGSATGDMWEYHHGFGPTAEDSALVLEGLLAAGTDPTILHRSAARLVEVYFDAGAGAFHTVHGGRARYWAGPSVDATAHVGWLLWRLDRARWAAEIGACRAFLRSRRDPGGCWRGRWFPSVMLTTFLAARLLATTDDGMASLGDTQRLLADTQRPDGSWGGSAIDTAFAIRTLRALGARPDAVASGRRWLAARRGADGWPGEPVLYYTMETDDPGVRFFFHCVDKGAVTSAWAALALRA
jgi:hypothetical protein